MSQGESGILPKDQSVVAIGSNESTLFGGALDIVKGAIDALSCDGISLLGASNLYETPCFPAGNGPDFVNAVVLVQSDLTPEKLLKRLHEIEADFGRKRAERWGRRTLDLDLIASGTEILPGLDIVQGWIDLPIEDQILHVPKHLILPHPRLQDRGFVLIPFADIAPAWVHPILGKSVSEMVNALPQAEKSAIQALT